MGYQHLTSIERGKIEALRKLNYSTRQIGSELNRHHSLIARELKRNDLNGYQAESAQAAYYTRRELSRPKGKLTLELKTLIEEKLGLTWSPEQIENAALSNQISFKTIYRWIYLGYLFKGNTQVLRQKGKRQKPKETRGRFNVGTSI